MIDINAVIFGVATIIIGIAAATRSATKPTAKGYSLNRRFGYVAGLIVGLGLGIVVQAVVG